MKPFPLVIILAIIMTSISPAAAADYEFTGFMLQPMDTLKTQKAEFENVRNLTFDRSADGDAIMLVHFKVPAGSTATYTIYYYGGDISGTATTYLNLSIIPPTTTTSVITLEGVTKQYNYLDTNPEYDYFLSGYAKNISNEAPGIIVYNAGYGSFDNDLAIFYELADVTSSLIYRLEIAGSEDFDIDITYAETEAVAAAADKSWVEIAYEWMAFAVSLAQTVYDFALAFFKWMYFLFVENIVMVIALYLAITMAYSASTAKNIFDFFKKFFGYQKKLYGFLIDMWNALIGLIATFRGIFRL